MEIIKPTEEQLNEIRNWVKLITYHERYSFETSLEIYKNKSLKEVILDDWNYNSELEKIEVWRPSHLEERCYIIDNCSHSPIDNKYDLPGVDDKLISHIHLDSTFIFDLDWWLQDGHQSYIWGSTNHKFGLLDKRGELDKDE